MANVFDVADYLIFLTSDVFDDMSNMKINKLLYYAQGHCLQETGHPLFNEPVEAWDHGPIVNSVFQRYKKYGKTPIKDYDQDAVSRLTDYEKELLMNVAMRYGVYTASALRNMTHKPKTPWDQVYDENSMHTEIPIRIIKEYFEKNVAPVKNAEIQFSDDDFVGRRDEDGILVLPKEWDE